MAELVAKLEDIPKLVRHLSEGESKDFLIPWQVTKQDIQVLNLRLAATRSGATYRVTKIAPTEIRVEVTPAVRGYTVTGYIPDLKSMDAPYRTRRI